MSIDHGKLLLLAEKWPTDRIRLILHEAIASGARHETQLALINTAIRNAVLQAVLAQPAEAVEGAVGATHPQAAPAQVDGGIPDPITHHDVTGTFRPHSLAYAAGWNDCREAMLAAAPAQEQRS